MQSRHNIGPTNITSSRKKSRLATVPQSVFVILSISHFAPCLTVQYLSCIRPPPFGPILCGCADAYFPFLRFSRFFWRVHLSTSLFQARLDRGDSRHRAKSRPSPPPKTTQKQPEHKVTLTVK